MQITHYSVFLAGALSFLSPCVLPLVPAYVSYVSGTSVNDLAGDPNAKIKGLLGTIFFGLGFTLVFIALGATATAIGSLMFNNRFLLAQIGGIVLIIFGLHLMGLFRITLLFKERKLRINFGVSMPLYLKSFILGVGFVLGWSPCIGPILSAVLLLAAQEDTVYQGMFMLSIYSLGLWIPFLICSVLVGSIMSLMSKYGKILRWIEITAGALLIIVGTFMFTGYIARINALFQSYFSFAVI